MDLSRFFTPGELLSAGSGFTLFSPAHLLWLCLSALVTALLCLAAHRADERTRKRLRRALGAAVLLCEAAKDAQLIAYGIFSVYYLPLHLCGLAVFFTAAHAFWGGRTAAEFLYSTCMPGALCALLFPDWTASDPFGAQSIIAFTVHTLLVAYPLTLVCGGDLMPDARRLPRCLALLIALAVPVRILDGIWNANYMFLLVPSPGSPLEWFASYLGVPGYLLGYIPMLAVIWLLLYLPFGRCSPRER